MIKKYVIVVSIITAILAVWLIIANWVIGCVSKQSGVKSVDFKKYDITNDVTYSFDEQVCRGDFLETMSLSGWAYVEAKEENPDRYVTLIMKNDKNCYEWCFENPTTRNLNRKDVARHFKLDYNNVGFVGEIPTYNIPNGTYELYIYCWENETTSGCSYTGKNLVKNGTSLEIKAWESEIAEVSDINESGYSGKTNLDSITTSGDHLSVSGWSFTNDKNSTDQNIYVFVDGVFYTTLTKQRNDVAKSYNNELYKDSGFSANIPLQSVPEGEFVLKIFTENDGVVYQCKSVTVNRTDEEISIVTVPSDSGYASVSGGQTAIELASVAHLAGYTVEDDIKCTASYDRIAVKNNALAVDGWVFIDGKNCDTQKVYLSVNGTSYNSVVKERADVARSHENDAYLMSGFSAYIPLDAIENGENVLKLLVEQDGTLYDCKTIYITVDGENVITASSPVSHIADINDYAVSSKSSGVVIDKISVLSNGLSVVGWGYLDGINSAEQRVFVTLNGTVYDSVSKQRNDVANLKQNEMYQMSGFSAIIPLNELKDEENILRISIENDGVIYHCKAYRLSVDGENVSYEKTDIPKNEVSVIDLSIYTPQIESYQSAFDYILVEDGMVNIAGWVGVDGKDTRNQTVYLKLNGDAYSTTKKVRTDVANSKSNSLLSQSGYYTSLPLELFNENGNSLQIVVKHDDVIYQCKEVDIFFDGDEAIVSSPKSSVVELPDYEIVDADYESRFDIMTVSRSSIELKGWVFLEDTDASDQKVYIIINDSVYLAQSVERSDVSNAYGDQYLMSGFKANLPLSELDDDMEIKLIVESGSALYECMKFVAVNNGDKLIIAD